MPRVYLYRIQADKALLWPFLLRTVCNYFFAHLFCLHARNRPVDLDASPNFRNAAARIVPFVAHRRSCRQTLVSMRVASRFTHPRSLTNRAANIDYGLLNFMADWFPIESREKLQANEQEVTREQLEALGIADLRVCRMM